MNKTLYFVRRLFETLSAKPVEFTVMPSLAERFFGFLGFFIISPVLFIRKKLFGHSFLIWDSPMNIGHYVLFSSLYYNLTKNLNDHEYFIEPSGATLYYKNLFKRNWFFHLKITSLKNHIKSDVLYLCIIIVLPLYMKFGLVSNVRKVIEGFDKVKRFGFQFAYHQFRNKELFSLSEREVSEGHSLLEGLGISKSDKVCLIHPKLGGYSSSVMGVRYGEDHRSWDLSTIRDAAIYLNWKGYKIVRMGHPHDISPNEVPPELIDYPAHPLYRDNHDFLDFFLVFTSSFVIGSNSGFNFIPYCLHKAFLHINFTPKHFVYASPRDYFLLKGVLKGGKPVPLADFSMSIEDLDPCSGPAAFTSLEQKGISLVCNTTEEILAAVVEFERDLHSCSKRSSSVNSQLRENFSRAHARYWGIKCSEPINLCNDSLNFCSVSQTAFLRQVDN